MTQKKPHRTPPDHLRRKVHEHQRWLCSDGAVGARFQGDNIELDNLDLRGVDLRYANLRNASFRRCLVNFAKFDKADMRGSQWHQSLLNDATFEDTALIDAVFLGCSYLPRQFVRADTSGVVWSLEDLCLAIAQEAGSIDLPTLVVGGP